MVSSRYKITYFMNGDISTTLENVILSKVYEHAVYYEALMEIEGSRWHAMVKNDAELRMFGMLVGDELVIAYQDTPLNPEIDTETITVTRMV
jgi:hypothetical protein